MWPILAMKITLPFHDRTMTVHLDKPCHIAGYLCTDDKTNEEIGILYQSGVLNTFEESVYSPPVEYHKHLNAGTYTPPYADWWQDEYQTRELADEDDDA